MMETADFEPGGYRYVRGPFQYSAGVAALPGFAIERVRFARPRPIAEGFQAIEAHLTAMGRPFTSFCACELRSPAPFDDAGFIAFNRVYVGTLERWGIFKNDENPVARSNVCPELNAPSEPVFQAFCYTVPQVEDNNDVKSFVIAGSGEATEGPGDYAERIVRLGETSADAMTDKARHVLDTMEARMAALDLSWADAGTTQVYSVYDLHPFLASEIIGRGAASSGLTWYYARPPVTGLDYEMDVRNVPVERII
ncbi:MAG: hypothetical protein HOA08_10825 [Rhodospirillaceae bacterium]|jgi:hypothetical protein|nr:hypothetical protein [Rhodospirillaceae bacterium]MBT3492038.1 hypothetical protein [Rhodospirillaceae bacterium]MBT3781396.1 hypothetical protein [Rhodospirillaceae bacterium]MBT3974974.1 hypothetical protein [Rhodospirillaceae bacterium]MBT4169339.1 hypothetical protein [Rhodospirillaceae bacterium]